MYHRVITNETAQADNEEPGMYVTPETFARHMQWLQQLMPIMRLSEWFETPTEQLPRRAAVVTFDDGWHDNYHNALPILQQHQIPATVFLVSHHIGTNRAFWPNRLALVLDRLAGLEDWPTSTNWLNLENNPESRKSLRDNEFKSRVIGALKPQADTAIIEKLEVLESDLGMASGETRSLLNWDEVKTMQASGLIDFGSHTCHHIRLNDNISPELIEQEITESIHKIESHTHRTPETFCFPNGDRSSFADKVVADNFSIAVTTKKGINESGCRATELCRIGFHEDISKTQTEFLARLANWR